MVGSVWRCCGLNYRTPTKRDVEVLTPSTYKCELIWKYLGLVASRSVRECIYVVLSYPVVLTDFGGPRTLIQGRGWARWSGKAAQRKWCWN